MSNIKLFESQKIRSHWDGEKEKWFFSVVDVIALLEPFKQWLAKVGYERIQEAQDPEKTITDYYAGVER